MDTRGIELLLALQTMLVAAGGVASALGSETESLTTALSHEQN